MVSDLDKNQHSVYRLTYHLVLVVKYRRQVITEEIFDRLIEIFNKNATNFDIILEESNFESDHIHLLFKAKPQTQLLKFIKCI
jgi:putative transposase